LQIRTVREGPLRGSQLDRPGETEAAGSSVTMCERPPALAAPGPGVALRTLALPVEHGGWGLLIEPIVLGLVLAPSPAGACLSAAALGAFLARHPLKIALADRRRWTRYPRTAAAERIAGFYAALAATALGAASLQGTGFFWLPLVLALPLAALQLAREARGRARDLPAELAGAVALGSVVSAIVLCGGWQAGPAFALWALIAARSVASVLYIRTRLRLDRGQAPELAPTWASHLAGLVIAGALAFVGWTPWLGVLAFAALAIRALMGLSASRGEERPRDIGFREMRFGLLTVFLVFLGYRLGI
jgi:hypothetical protein